MNRTPIRASKQQGASDYELRLHGHLDARWAARLDAASLVNELDGTTTVVVRGIDQAALHGVLQQIRDLGLPLLAVTLIAGARGSDGRAFRGRSPRPGGSHPR